MWGFLGAVIGGALVLAGSYFANRAGNKSKDKRWLADAALKQRDQTAERLRKLYAPLVQSTVVFQRVAFERGYVSSVDGTVDVRDERHARELNAAADLLTAVGGELLVDADAKPIRNLYNDFRRTFDRYLAAWESTDHGAAKARAIETLRDELSKLADDIQDFAETHLSALSAPPSQRDLD